MEDSRRRGSDKLLFTPGPLTTSASVKRAMLRDLGSREAEFVAVVRDVRRALLRTAGLADRSGWEAVPIQGSGTQGLEAVLGSVAPGEGTLLVPANGAYGARLAEIGRRLGIDTRALASPESEPLDPAAVEAALDADPAVRCVALVHCETSTGLVNPVADVGRIARRRGACFVVDAMSTFGGVPLDLEDARVDFLVSSPNKCIEGVPGFSFAICRREALLESEGRARSFALDLLAQWRGLESNGQFRFTPPTHAFLACEQALAELEVEGGVAGRAARYAGNHARLLAGMRALGFETYLPDALQSVVITAFRVPSHPRFAFAELYRRLSQRGFVIYPGSISAEETFRIGTIGRIFPRDVDALLDAIRAVLHEMGVDLAAAQSQRAASRRSTSG